MGLDVRVKGATFAGLVGREYPLRVEFEDGINIIYGFNGAGKTTILKLISAALANSTESLSDIGFQQCIIHLLNPFTNENITKRISKSREYKVKETAFSHSLESEFDYFISEEKLFSRPADVDISSDEKEWGDFPFDHTLLLTDRVFKRLSNDGIGQDDRFSRDLRYVWSQYNNRLLSEEKAIQEELIYKQLAPTDPSNIIETSGNIHQIYERVLRFISSKDYLGVDLDFDKFLHRYREDIYFKRLIGMINEAQKKIDHEDENRNNFKSILEELFKDKGVKLFKNNIHIYSQGYRISIDQLSSGEKHLLFMLTNILNTDSGLIMIDEPEISLHVAWQRRIYEIIEEINPRAQIILATHSPEIFTSARKRGGNIIKID